MFRTPYGWFYSHAGPERRKPCEDDVVRPIVRRDARVTDRPDRRRQREGRHEVRQLGVRPTCRGDP